MAQPDSRPDAHIPATTTAKFLHVVPAFALIWLVLDPEATANWHGPVAVALITITSIVLDILLAMRLRRDPRVSGIFIYPIKSCAEMSLARATAKHRGFAFDRLLQVSDADGKWCTPRDPAHAKLFHVKPTIGQGDDGRLLVLRMEGQPTGTVHLQGGESKPAGAEYMPYGVKAEYKKAGEGPPPLRDLGDTAAAWLAAATGIDGCRLVGVGEGYARCAALNPKQGDTLPYESAPVSLADEAPYLLTTEASLADLNGRLRARGKPAVDMRRFRPNLVLRGGGLRPWEEDTWKRIRLGGVEFHVWQRCARCAMTTIDRDTLARGPEPLATLTTFRERDNGCRNFGMMLIPVEGMPSEGAPIEVGDKLEVLEVDEERRAEWVRLMSR